MRLEGAMSIEKTPREKISDRVDEIFAVKDKLDILNSFMERFRFSKETKLFEKKNPIKKKKKYVSNYHKKKILESKYYESTLTKKQKSIYRKISKSPKSKIISKKVKDIVKNVKYYEKIFARKNHKYLYMKYYLKEKYNKFQPTIKKTIQRISNSKGAKLFGKSLGVLSKIDDVRKIWNIATGDEKGEDSFKFIGGKLGDAAGKMAAVALVGVFPELIPIAPIISTSLSIGASKLGEALGGGVYKIGEKLFSKPAIKTKPIVKEKAVKIVKRQETRTNKKQSIKINKNLPSMTQLLNNLSKPKKNTKGNSKGSAKELNMRELSRLVANNMTHNINLRLANM